MTAHAKIKPDAAPPADSFGKVTRALARAALADANNESLHAAAILRERLLADPALCRANLDRLVQAFASVRISEALHEERSNITRPFTIPTVDGSTFRAAVDANLTRLMDMPLWGGKRIADATPDEVRTSAAEYASAASDLARKARWQVAVADACEKTGKPTVREALDEATLGKLWETANGQ